ncbi:NARE ribosyltransferase, partial [Thryothorus ludovicianus]|nr:NARE ribosyltransferase [Thryothorus ludovicianus]
TLALLPIAVATVTNDVVFLDMAPDSFDDQYRDCGPAMTEELLALNRSDLEQNPLFAQVWVKAAAEWQSQRAPVSPLSPAQAIAITAYTMKEVYEKFNAAVRTVGRSSQVYRDKFHFKTLHFLLTQALVTLKEAQKRQCHEVFLEVCGYWFEAQPGATVRFGKFVPMGINERTSECEGTETLFKVHTCH